jgi:hypothetical protein
MNSDLKELMKDKKEQVVMDYFDFEAWLKAKINNTSFAKEVRLKNKS